MLRNHPPHPLPGPSAGGTGGAAWAAAPADGAPVDDPVPLSGGALPAGEAELAPPAANGCPARDPVALPPAGVPPCGLAAAPFAPLRGGKWMFSSLTSPECFVSQARAPNRVALGVLGAASNCDPVRDGIALAFA
jgi:hypothetical protein